MYVIQNAFSDEERQELEKQWDVWLCMAAV